LHGELLDLSSQRESDLIGFVTVAEESKAL
jgi:hypothetical protein